MKSISKINQADTKNTQHSLIEAHAWIKKYLTIMIPILYSTTVLHDYNINTCNQDTLMWPKKWGIL